MKTTVSTEWLSGCSGCHVAVVDLHEKLLQLVDTVEFVRIPVLMDEKGFPPADIGLIEGAIRTTHDRECAKKMRESVTTLIAFGTCAVYGGPSGIGWLHDPATVMETVFRSGPTNEAKQHVDDQAPELEQSVVPIDEVVPVDLYLPGCPPHPYWIAAAITSCAKSGDKTLGVQTVCASCNRTMKKNPGVTLRPGQMTAPDPDLCFLSQGVLCMGSVSLDRCKAPCPAHGAACTGCTGPSLDIITEPHRDLRTQLAQRMHRLTGIEESAIVAHIEQEAPTFYSYALASPVIYKKPAVNIREWMTGPDSEHRFAPSSTTPS